MILSILFFFFPNTKIVAIKTTNLQPLLVRVSCISALKEETLAVITTAQLLGFVMVMTGKLLYE